MRYWHPFTADAIYCGRNAILQLEGFAPDELVLLPLYPQYSRTTIGSSLNEWSRLFHPGGWQPRLHMIEEFHEDPDYLKSLVDVHTSTNLRVDTVTNALGQYRVPNLPVGTWSIRTI
jgi:protoporphyrin/coproporphyrin ferrochelatase